MHHFILLYFAITVTITTASPFSQNSGLLDNNDSDTVGIVPNVISQFPDETADNLDMDTMQETLLATNNEEVGEYNEEQTDENTLKSETDLAIDFVPGKADDTETERVKVLIENLKKRTEQLNKELDALVRKRVSKKPSGRKPATVDNNNNDNNNHPQNSITQAAEQIGSQIGTNFQQLLLLTNKYHPPTPNLHLSPQDIHRLVQKLAEQGTQQLSNLNVDALVAGAVAVAGTVGIVLKDTALVSAVIEALPEIVGGLALVLLI